MEMVKIAVSIPMDTAVRVTQAARAQQVTNGEALARALTWAMREPARTDTDRAFSRFLEAVQEDPRRRRRVLQERMKRPSWVAARDRYDQRTNECLAVIANARREAA